MGNEQLTTFQAAQLKWLKQQVDNLQDERYRKDSRPNIHRELFAAREDLDNYVQSLRDRGYRI
jgi:biotin operon repressor